MDKSAIALVVVMVTVFVAMAVRTGRIVGHSAARLTMIAAAILAQHHAAPEVAREFVELFGQRHWLVKIGQEVTKRLSLRHDVSSRMIAASSSSAGGRAP